MRGDIDQAEAAFRRAEERGDPDGPYNLGVLLENECRDVVGAVEAFRRADEAGHREAAGVKVASLNRGEWPRRGS